MHRKNITHSTDELYSYLKELKKIPVISHKRQIEIFESLKNETLTDMECGKLKEELVIGNLRFVITIAKQYQNLGLDLLDLISEGNIGLLKCMDNFDHTKGVKFISYGVWWIKQSIMSALNDYSRTIRIPSNLIQESQKQKKEPINDNEKPKTGYTESLPYCVGLYDEINEEGDQLIDLIRDPNEQSPEMFTKSDVDMKIRVAKALSVLDERERIIIEKTFGINGVESNLEDLGEEFNCTKERVRQIKDKAIKKLRNESFSLFNYL